MNKKIIISTISCAFVIGVCTSICFGQNKHKSSLKLKASDDSSLYFESNKYLSIEYNVPDTRNVNGMKITLEDNDESADKWSIDYKNYIRKSDLENGFLEISFGYGEPNNHDFDYLLVTLTDAVNEDSKVTYAVAPQPVTSQWWNVWTASWVTMTDEVEQFVQVRYQNNNGLKLKGTNQSLIGRNNSFIGTTNSYYTGPYMDVGFNLGRKDAMFFPATSDAVMNSLTFKYKGTSAYINSNLIGDFADKDYISAATSNIVGTKFEDLYSTNNIENLFSSGFCKMNISFMGVHTNKISAHIKKLGDQTIGTGTIKNSTPLFEIGSKTNAVLGYEYIIPNTKITDYREGDISSKVNYHFYTANGETVLFEGNSVLFPDVGTYRMAASVALNDGSLFETEKTIICYGDMPKTTFSMNAKMKKSYKTGDVVQVPAARAINDLSTNFDKSVTPSVVIQNNGATLESFDASASNYFTLTESGRYVLAYLFQNAYGKVDVKSYNFTVEKSIGINPPYVPKTLTSNKKTQLEDFVPVDYISNKNSNDIYRAIYLNNEQIYLAKGNEVISGSLIVNKTFNECGSAKLIYKAGYSKDNLEYSKEYDVMTIKPKFAEDYLVLTQDGVLAKDKFEVNGSAEEINLTFNKDSSIELPQKLYFNDLSFSFDIKKENNNLNDLEVLLTDPNNSYKQVSIQIKPIDNTTSKVYLNGEYANDIQGSFVNNDAFFSWQVDGGNSRIVDSSGNNVTGRIKTWSDGTSFNGFSDGACLLSFTANGVTGNTSFALRKVNNNPFTLIKVGSLISTYTDKYSPIIVTEDIPETFTYGEYVRIPSAKCYDVLSPETTLTVKVTDADNNVIYNGNIDSDYRFLADKFGKFIVIYSSCDGNENFKGETRFVFTIKDEIDPVITLKGDVPTSVALNSTITLPEATVFDSVKKDITYSVYVLAPNGNRKYVADRKYKFDQVGVYEVIYYAVDDYSNFASLTFEINVA